MFKNFLLCAGLGLCFTSLPIFGAQDKIHGVLITENEAMISSQIAAKVQSIPFKEGDNFKKGATLIALDCHIFRSDLKKAKSAYMLNETYYTAAKYQYKHNALSKAEYDKAQSEYSAAAAELAIKEHIVSQCTIKAPFPGTISKLHIRAHETVDKGQSLVSIVNNKKTLIKMILPSQWLGWLKPNSPFKFTVNETNKSYTAHISKIVSHIDAVSQTFTAYGKFNRSYNGLITGMSGLAIFSNKKEKISHGKPA